MHGEVERLRAIGPLVRITMPGDVPAWVATRHQVLRELLEDPRVAKNSEHWSALTDGTVPDGWPLIDFVTNPGMTTADGDDHRRLRTLVTKAFTPRRVAAMRPDIEASVDSLLDSLATHAPGPVDLRRHFAYPLPMRMIGQLLGVPSERFDEFRHLSASLISSTTSPEETLETGRKLYALLTDLVASKRAAPGEDLTSALIDVREDGDRLTEAELTGTLTLMLIAGHGTTLNLITNAVRALLTHPEQLAAVRSGERPWGAVIEETLRWNSPVAHFPMRYATEDITVGEVTIPKGEALLASYVAAGRDPEQYGPDAGEFDISRESIRHLSFGHGPHFCIGAGVARLEAEVALPALFDRFPELALGVPEAELTAQPSFVSNSVAKLPVTLGGDDA
ncbi:cytochrome [Streptomyces oceani]|uniref:Cytochrome n=1 Tax=Streptomyces oceani TaxID=1075402 RepID=A0A1E7KGW5_9ACTN|nr:cytochrome [Streptomyces oceani]